MLLSILLSLQIVVYDELEPAFPDVVFTQAGEQDAKFESASSIDMPAAIHVFVPASSGEKVSLEFSHYRFTSTSGEGGAAGNTRSAIPSLSISRLHSVPVEENTGLGSRTEQFEGKKNPHVIRRAPFRVFDPIEPLTHTELGFSAIAEEGGVGFRIQVSPDQAGSLGIDFDIKVGDWKSGDDIYKLRWDITTYNFKLIPRNEYGFNYTNWFSLQEIEQRHNLELWSEDFWTMLGKYADLMAYGGQDTFWLRWTDFYKISEDGDWTLNSARLERYVSLFLDAGFHWIEGAPIASRPNGDWSSPWLKLSLGGVPATSDEGEAIILIFILIAFV